MRRVFFGPSFSLPVVARKLLVWMCLVAFGLGAAAQRLVEPVGSTSVVQTAQVTFSSAGAVGALAVLTQGAEHLDFNFAPGGTCFLGGTYAVGQTCTVNFTFTPGHPGARYGGIVAQDGTGNALAAAYVQGWGTGPQVIWNPGTQTALGSGFVQASGVAVDASGNVFVSDLGGNAVLEIPAGGGTSRVLGTFTEPDDVAVDGMGNVFVISNRTTLSEIVAVNGVIPATPAIVTISTGFGALNGMKVDGNGNVFVAGATSGGTDSVIQEVLAVNGSIPASPQIVTLVHDVGGPTGVAVDASGDLFVSDELGNRVYEVAAVNGSIPASPVVTTLASVDLPSNIVMDGAGNLFVSNVGSTKVVEILAVNGVVPAGAATVVLGQGLSSPQGLAVDGSGNVYVADGGLPGVAKLDFADPPALTFAATYVGSTSVDSPQTVTMINDGNADLLLPNLFGRNPSITAGFTLGGSSTCAGASAPQALASNGSCLDVVSFTPVAAGVDAGFLVTTDNALNVGGATQSVPLRGTGLALIPTTTTLSAAPNPVPFSKVVTLTAVVSSSGGLAVGPSGVVTFSIDGAAVGTVHVVNATASFATATLAVGTHTVGCAYSGDTRYVGSTCNTVVVTVTPQDFSLTANPPSISIQTEHHGTMQLALASIGGWTGPVTLACGGGLPAWLTCELPSAPVSLGANVTMPVAFTIDTDAVQGFKASVGLVGLLPLVLLRRRRVMRTLVLLVGFVVVLTALNGCGGKYPEHTAAGTYTVAVIATGTNAGSSVATTHTLNVTVTVTP